VAIPELEALLKEWWFMGIEELKPPKPEEPTR
jgi:hypothetical protein